MANQFVVGTMVGGGLLSGGDGAAELVEAVEGGGDCEDGEGKDGGKGCF